MENTKTPVRRGSLGEDRVLKPFQVDEIAIVGKGLTAVQFAEDGYAMGYLKDRMQVWAMNEAAYAFNCDMAWSIHDRGALEFFWAELKRDMEKNFALLSKQQDSQGNVLALKNLKVPLVLAEALEELPNSVEYPLEEVFVEFNDTYFTNTLPYTLAFALMCKPKRIHLFGCDFNYGGVDHVSEAGKPCAEYWLGQARARGIELNLPPTTALLDMQARAAKGIYGYSKQPICKRDEAGNILGIDKFVDPTEHRIDKGCLKEIAKRVNFGGDNPDMQAKIAMDIVCKSLGITPLMLIGYYKGVFEFRQKAGLNEIML